MANRTNDRSARFMLCTMYLYPTGMGRDNDFQFSEPWYIHSLLGQADGNNSALCPALHNTKSHRGKCPNVITHALSRHCGDNQKVIDLHLNPAIPRLPSKMGAVDTNDWCITFKLGLSPRYKLYAFSSKLMSPSCGIASLRTSEK